MASCVVVEVNMLDISSVKCCIIPSSSELNFPADYASKVFQRYVSTFQVQLLIAQLLIVYYYYYYF